MYANGLTIKKVSMAKASLFRRLILRMVDNAIKINPSSNTIDKMCSAVFVDKWINVVSFSH
ncbi:hypothetical protein LOOC260_117850 [Paucilactobacillus hokkaidonensis JCM 18461]|uniref:Uncharacterized protein n=1 Tax=Paucilactobacillus hokkaidonensis JCM 18461 TaxID=1291742 RepID=A0A0A1GVL5_9LACO|nr:hypothetical protein LOOC260_117850 [Paucilactobacillus hokkaidonensis JCM 18461]